VLGGRRLRKKYLARGSITAAAKADIRNMLFIAAVNRCAPKIKRKIDLCRQTVKVMPFPFVEKSELFRAACDLRRQERFMRLLLALLRAHGQHHAKPRAPADHLFVGFGRFF
jgi:hypothetical protein